MIVAAHLGRPKGAPDPQFSLAPVAARLGELLGTTVPLAADVAGDDAQAKAAALADGDVLLLENVRFEAAETSKDDAERGELADRLAALADVYVDDAFGAVHRKHASVFDVAERLPHYAGRLVARELDVLTRLTTDPERPYVVVLGGSKVSDKLAVIEALLPKVDRLLVGGGMCFTFLAAQGHGVGRLAAGGRPGRHLPPAAGRGRATGSCCRSTSSARDRVQRRRRDERRPGRRESRTGSWASTSARAPSRCSAPSSATPAPCSGTARWASSSWPRSRRAPAGSPQAVAAVDGLSVVGGGDSAAAVRQLGPRRGRLRPHQHRRRRVAGVPRGPGAPGPRGARRPSGELTWHARTAPGAPRGPAAADRGQLEDAHDPSRGHRPGPEARLLPQRGRSWTPPRSSSCRRSPRCAACRPWSTGDKLAVGYGAQDLSAARLRRLHR